VVATRKALPESKPDVILLDLRLGDGDGLDLTRELTECNPAIRVIVLSQREEDAYAHRALANGARGYIMKSAAPETLLTAINTVLRGEIYVSRSVATRLMHNLFPDPASTAPQLARLSDRELQVFRMLGSGQSNRQIAEHLRISHKTVETYREHLKEKLNLPDSHALLRAATLWVEKGKLDLP
jgi:DNA-binding NarL/FixJ family response regulator